MYDIFLIIQTFVVIFLIGIILIQRSDSDGFGTGTGGGGNQFMTGRASANLITRATAILATLFIVLSLVLASMASQRSGSSIVDRVSTEAPVAPAKNAPAAEDKGTAEQSAPEKQPLAPKFNVPKPE